MLITPYVSEKSYKMASDNVYVFEVPVNASKSEVISAILSQYEGVKIKDVRMMITKGKPKAVNRGKRARPLTANRSDVKKAYVTVLEGKIEIAAFSEIENQEKADEAESAKIETKEVQTETKVTAKKTGLFARRRTGRRGDR